MDLQICLLKEKMLPNVSNIDIAKSKRPTHELIVAAY